MGWKLMLAVALVIAVTPQCARGQAPTSIQFSFETTPTTGSEAEALRLGGTQTITVPVMVNIVPTTTILQGDIVIGITITGGTAQSGSDFVLVRNQVTFDIGANDGNTISVLVNIRDDFIVEGPETFTLTGSVVTAGTIATFVGGPVTITILDNDVRIGWEFVTYQGAEGAPAVMACATVIAGAGNLGGFSVSLQITANPNTAVAADYGAPNPNTFTFNAAQTRMCTAIAIVDDTLVEGDVDETFTLLLSPNNVPANLAVQLAPAVTTVAIDDNDMFDPCTPTPCDPNAMCERMMMNTSFTCTCIPPFIGDGMTCMRPVALGDDPHFSIVLPGGKLLCYTVQGEHGFSFNLITSKKLTMNAMFVPDARRKEVTWLGSIGVVVANTQYKGSNMTKLKFDVDTREVHIGEKVTLKAKNIEELTFRKGKLSISEAPPKKGFRYPAVKVNLDDVGLSFTIKYTGNHLDMFWHSVGEQREDSHGLIGQFFRRGVGIDTVRKILILPGKEPVSVMRRPVWSFMERAPVVDDQLCWTAMNPGYQGEGLIDGTYFDYLVDDVLSTGFQFKPKGHSYPNGDADEQ